MVSTIKHLSPYIKVDYAALAFTYSSAKGLAASPAVARVSLSLRMGAAASFEGVAM